MLLVRFAHRSEIRFARLLDFYRIRWEYEPHVHARDEGGDRARGVSPDFWLPDLGVTSITVLRQCLVTPKTVRSAASRAVPQATVRLLYRRDLEAPDEVRGQ